MMNFMNSSHKARILPDGRSARPAGPKTKTALLGLTRTKPLPLGTASGADEAPLRTVPNYPQRRAMSFPKRSNKTYRLKQLATRPKPTPVSLRPALLVILAVVGACFALMPCSVTQKIHRRLVSSEWKNAIDKQIPFYDCPTIKNVDGNEYSPDDHRGKVVMVINVASECDNTAAAYEVLKYFHETYAWRGLDIILTPCSQFGFWGGQERKDGAVLKEQILKLVAGLANCKNNVCTISDNQALETLKKQESKKSRLFITEKMDVETRFGWFSNTYNTGELWLYLKKRYPSPKQPIPWNFGTTFLINSQGAVSYRYNIPDNDSKKLINGSKVKANWKNTIEKQIRRLLGLGPIPKKETTLHNSDARPPRSPGTGNGTSRPEQQSLQAAPGPPPAAEVNMIHFLQGDGVTVAPKLNPKPDHPDQNEPMALSQAALLIANGQASP